MFFRIVTWGSAGRPFWMVMVQGAEDAAELLGIEIVFDLAGGELVTQLTVFAEAVAGRPDGIGVVIGDDLAWDKPVADAIAAGIPVVALNVDDVDGALGNPRLGFMGQSERLAGFVIGMRLFEEGRKKGVDFAKAHVLMPVEFPGTPYADGRGAGVRAAGAEFGVTSYEVLDSTVDVGIAEARITAYLLANPQTTFIAGLGGIPSDRIPSSLKALGYEPGEIISSAFDTTPGIFEGIRDGYIIATIDQQPYLQGFHSVIALFLHVKYGFAYSVNTGGLLIETEEHILAVEKWAPENIR